jgi:site-specific recombinase XerC
LETAPIDSITIVNEISPAMIVSGSIRMVFDWLVAGQILAQPADAVRGPKQVVKRRKTPVLTADQTRRLIEGMDVSTLVGLRDRALIGS